MPQSARVPAAAVGVVAAATAAAAAAADPPCGVSPPTVAAVGEPAPGDGKSRAAAVRIDATVVATVFAPLWRRPRAAPPVPRARPLAPYHGSSAGRWCLNGEPQRLQTDAEPPRPPQESNCALARGWGRAVHTLPVGWVVAGSGKDRAQLPHRRLSRCGGGRICLPSTAAPLGWCFGWGRALVATGDTDSCICNSQSRVDDEKENGELGTARQSSGASCAVVGRPGKPATSPR